MLEFLNLHFNRQIWFMPVRSLLIPPPIFCVKIWVPTARSLWIFPQGLILSFNWVFYSLLPACFGKGMEMSITFCCLVADGGWVGCRPLCWVQWYRQGRFTIGPIRAKAAITQLTFCLHQAGVSWVFAMLKTQAVVVDYASVFLNLKTGFWCTLLLDVFLSFICILVWKWEKKMNKLEASGNRFTPIFPIILLCLWNRYYSSTSIWPFYESIISYRWDTS